MSRIDRDSYEGDIVSRLRAWRGLHLAHGGALFEEAANEIEQLREYRDLAESDAAIASLVVDRLRITAAEREAIKTCIADDEAMTHHSRAATLRGLLERMK